MWKVISYQNYKTPISNLFCRSVFSIARTQRIYFQKYHTSLVLNMNETRASLVKVRKARIEDVPIVRDIYSWYVLNSAATFEEDIPSLSEMEDRYQSITSSGYPFLVATKEVKNEDQVVGYAYVDMYRKRTAYRFTVENSIYLDKNFIGQGVGTILLDELIAKTRELGYCQIIAVIGGINPASVKLHSKKGFKMVGVHPEVGWKFDEWQDCTHMILPLHPESRHIHK